MPRIVREVEGRSTLYLGPLLVRDSGASGVKRMLIRSCSGLALGTCQQLVKIMKIEVLLIEEWERSFRFFCTGKRAARISLFKCNMSLWTKTHRGVIHPFAVRAWLTHPPNLNLEIPAH